MAISDKSIKNDTLWETVLFETGEMESIPFILRIPLKKNKSLKIPEKFDNALV